MKSRARNRRSTGAAMVVLLVFVISTFILLALGAFSFEVSRAHTAQDELRSAVESATLAAAAALASSDARTSAAAHLNAIVAAHDAFNANSIVGMPLGLAGTASNRRTTPPLRRASLFLEFQDPNNNNAPTAGPDYENGLVVYGVAAFNLPPAFSFPFMGPHPIRAESKARTPTLDLVLCFDCSGSIDDQTVVTFVRRRWNGNRVVYDIVDAPAGSHMAGTTGRAAGKIYDILTPKPVGSGVQATPPHSMASVYGDLTPLVWDDVSRTLRSADPGTDVGTPPGNFSAPVAYTPQHFTDIVVNLDERQDFAGFSSGPYIFPDVATLVEAARGNLENYAVFNSSRANTGVPSNVVPRAGYRDAYMEIARQKCEPIGSARQAALRFYQIMKQNTDARFGFVGFASDAHTQPSDTVNNWVVSHDFAAGGRADFPIPGIELSPSNSNYTEITNASSGLLQKTLANGGTNIGMAIQRATDMLSGPQSRTYARRSIIMFTDGHWNTGPDPVGPARQAALADKGISIYTIGLAQNSAIIPFEVDTLNDGGSGTTYSFTDPQTGQPGSYTATKDGISKIAGNGGKFFLVTDSANLNYVFENIARHLVQLVRGTRQGGGAGGG